MGAEETAQKKKVDFSTVTAVLLLVVVFILFFYDIFYLDRSLVYGDNLYVFLPFKELLWDSLKSFRIPHWTALSACGFPFLSIVFPGTFYLPDYLFFLLFPGYKALSLSLVLHLLLGGLSLYAYMRRLKVSSFASLISALVFSCWVWPIRWAGHWLEIAQRRRPMRSFSRSSLSAESWMA